MKRLTKLVPGLTLLALLFAITAAAKGSALKAPLMNPAVACFPALQRLS